MSSFKKLTVALCLFVCVSVISWFLLRPLWKQLKAEWDLEQEMVLLDTNDPGWTLEAIQRRQPEIPPGENGAMVLMQLSKAIPDQWPIWNNWHDPGKEPDEDAPPDAKKKHEEQKAIYELARPLHDLELGPRKALPANAKDLLKTELQRVAHLIASIEQMRAFTQGNFEENEWPYDAYRIVHALGWQTELDAQDNRGSAILQRAELLTHIARIFPCHGSHNLDYRQYCWRSAIRTLESGLSLHEGSEDRLARFQQLVAAEEKDLKGRFIEAARHDRAAMHETLLEFVYDEKKFDRWTLGEIPDRWAYENLGIQAWRAHHVLFLRETNEHIEKFKNGWAPEDTQQGGHRWCLSCIPMEKWYQRFTPEIQYSVWRFYCCTSTLRTAQFAIACERYRLQHGNWPANSEALVPVFLPHVPVDPLTKAPLELRRVDDHWEVAPLTQRTQKFWLWNPNDRRLRGE